MKDYFKDYLKLCKDCGKFYKRHWRGTIVLNIVCIVGMFMPYIFNKIEEKMLSKWYDERVKEMDNEKERSPKGLFFFCFREKCIHLYEHIF